MLTPPPDLDNILDVDLSAFETLTDNYFENMKGSDLSKMLNQLSPGDRSGASTALPPRACSSASTAMDAYDTDVNLMLDSRAASAETARAQQGSSRGLISPIPPTGRSSAPPAAWCLRPASSLGRSTPNTARKSPELSSSAPHGKTPRAKTPNSSATSRGATPLPALREQPGAGKSGKAATFRATPPPGLSLTPTINGNQATVKDEDEDEIEDEAELRRPGTAIGIIHADTQESISDNKRHAVCYQGHFNLKPTKNKLQPRWPSRAAETSKASETARPTFVREATVNLNDESVIGVHWNLDAAGQLTSATAARFRRMHRDDPTPQGYAERCYSDQVGKSHDNLDEYWEEHNQRTRLKSFLGVPSLK